jgi:hypothetical protein
VTVFRLSSDTADRREILRRLVAGGAPPPGPTLSEIISVEILGDVRVPDPAGDGQQGTKGKGWVAKITTPFRVSQTFRPRDIIFEEDSPGFNDASGVEKVATRTFRAGEQMRLQFVQGSVPPSNTLRLASQVGPNLEIYVSLEQCAYAGRPVRVRALDGFYGPGSVGGAVANVVNNSTRAHHEPQVGWLDYAGRAVGATMTVEALVKSVFARSGQQAAAVGFYAKDASGHTTPEVIVGAPVLSDVINGQVAGTARPEVWRATIDTSGLNPGDACNLFLNVYPWVGPKWSMEANGILFPSPRADAALRFVADRDGTYGGVYAYVNAQTGVDATGVASLNPATARATPCATIDGALSKIKAFNAAPGAGRIVHNDIGGGCARLMDNAGAAYAHVMTATVLRTGGIGFCTIEADPLNAAAASISQPTANIDIASGIRFRVPVDFGAAGIWGNSNANSFVIYDGFPVTPSGTYPNYKINAAYMLNVPIQGTAANKAISQSFNNNAHLALVAGCSGVGTGTCAAAVMTANFFTGINWSLNILGSNPDIVQGAICYNNRFMKLGTTGGCYASRTGGPRGVALVQNVFEPVFIGSCLRIGGDSELNEFENFNCQLNTIPGPTATGGDGGARFNVAYNDVAAAARLNKEAILLFNNFNNTNTKTDTFDGTIVDPTGRTGGYFTAYRCMSKGNVILKSNKGGDVSFDPDGGVAGPSGGAWLGMHGGVGDKTNVSMAFVDNKSANATGGPGLGDYHLANGAANPAVGMVPAGEAVLGKDLGGAPRKNNGDGAAGAYERTDI